LGKDIKWNFAKYLVRGSDGQVVNSYEPPTGPLSFEQDIVALHEQDKREL
jgi:glutathione peroxidase-family protein